jgi:integrase/recombinase XerD
MLFYWLVVGHVMDVNPAHAVRGPKHVVKKGKTPVLTADEARVLLDSIDTSTVMGLRGPLIALMAYTFARIGGGRCYESGRLLRPGMAQLGAAL